MIGKTAELKESLIFVLDNEPSGDLILQNGTLRFYWSPMQWVDPRMALIAHPEDWLYLGMDGWWSDQEQRELFERVKLTAGELWPGHPGEWCRLDDVKQTVSYWRRRALKAERALLQAAD